LASLKLRGGKYPSDPVKQCCGVSTRAHAMGQMHAVCGWHVPGMSWHAPGMSQHVPHMSWHVPGLCLVGKSLS